MGSGRATAGGDEPDFAQAAGRPDLSSDFKGRPIGKPRQSRYYEEFFSTGWQAIQESLARLSQEFDLLICEGAGSPAEINLKHRDLANMRIATYLEAPTILIADIDRGGVFAHIVGTLELLEPEERSLIKGIVINKFRGQRSILQPGIEWLEERTGIPVIGVIPWIDEAFPAEDSLSLLERPAVKTQAEITVAVIRLPRISNFTDFDALEAEPSVNVKYLSPKDNLGYPDAVILPGTKTTISDLLVLQQTGMAEAICNYAAAGGTVIGICGGFQIMGQMLADPEGLEGQEGRFDGLGLLPLRTVITQQKVARQRTVTSKYPQEGLPVVGYEIHQGRTQLVMSRLAKRTIRLWLFLMIAVLALSIRRSRCGGLICTAFLITAPGGGLGSTGCASSEG